MKKINSGFTLVELMVSLAVLGVLLAIGIPSFQETIRNQRMTSDANKLSGALSFTRLEAVRRGNVVHFGQRAAGDWTGGYVAWVDADGDATWDAGEELRVWEPLSTTTTLTLGTATTSFVFSGTGEVDTGNTFTLCDDRSGETGRIITLLTSGLIRAATVPCT